MEATEGQTEQQVDHRVHVENEERGVARRAPHFQKERDDLVAEIQVSIHIRQQAQLNQSAQHFQVRRHPVLLDQRLHRAVEAFGVLRLHGPRVLLLRQPQKEAQRGSAELLLRGEERQHRDQRLLHARLQNHLLRQLRTRRRPRGARRQHGASHAAIAHRLGNAQLLGEMARSLGNSQFRRQGIASTGSINRFIIGPIIGSIIRFIIKFIIKSLIKFIIGSIIESIFHRIIGRFPIERVHQRLQSVQRGLELGHRSAGGSQKERHEFLHRGIDQKQDIGLRSADGTDGMQRQRRPPAFEEIILHVLADGLAVGDHWMLRIVFRPQRWEQLQHARVVQLHAALDYTSPLPRTDTARREERQRPHDLQHALRVLRFLRVANEGLRDVGIDDFLETVQTLHGDQADRAEEIDDRLHGGLDRLADAGDDACSEDRIARVGDAADRRDEATARDGGLQIGAAIEENHDAHEALPFNEVIRTGRSHAEDDLERFQHRNARRELVRDRRCERPAIQQVDDGEAIGGLLKRRLRSERREDPAGRNHDRRPIVIERDGVQHVFQPIALAELLPKHGAGLGDDADDHEDILADLRGVLIANQNGLEGGGFGVQAEQCLFRFDFLEEVEGEENAGRRGREVFGDVEAEIDGDREIDVGIRVSGLGEKREDEKRPRNHFLVVEIGRNHAEKRVDAVEDEKSVDETVI